MRSILIGLVALLLIPATAQAGWGRMWSRTVVRTRSVSVNAGCYGGHVRAPFVNVSWGGGYYGGCGTCGGHHATHSCGYGHGYDQHGGHHGHAPGHCAVCARTEAERQLLEGYRAAGGITEMQRSLDALRQTLNPPEPPPAAESEGASFREASDTRVRFRKVSARKKPDTRLRFHTVKLD